MNRLLRIERLDKRIPQHADPASSWDLSRWTDAEVDEAAVLSDKLRAVMDAEPWLPEGDVISRALTVEEMERAAVLGDIATGQAPPAQRISPSWPDGWTR